MLIEGITLTGRDLGLISNHKGNWKRVYVDTENITNYDWLDSIRVGKGDRIVLVTSDKSKRNIPMDDMFRLVNTGAMIEEERGITGRPNLLDMYLLSVMFLNIGLERRKGGEYIVVSNDKSFKMVTDTIKSKLFDYGVTFRHIGTTKNVEDLDLYNKAKALSDNPCEIHNMLQREYGVRGVEIYKKYKGH